MLSSPQLRRKSVTIGLSDVAQFSLHLSHLISWLWLGMRCGWLLNQFFSIVCSHFLSLGLLVCSSFSEAKEWFHIVSLITQLVELSLLGCNRLSPWLSCRALGDWVTSSLQSFLTWKFDYNQVPNRVSNQKLVWETPDPDLAFNSKIGVACQILQT